MKVISVESNIVEILKRVETAKSRLIPYAAGLALTSLVKIIADSEKRNEIAVLDRPRPFTTNAIGTVGASSKQQFAKVYMKDITAKYMDPYEFGGNNMLNSRALLKPVGAKEDLDAFGNLPQAYLRKLVGLGGSKTNKRTGELEAVAGSSIRSDVFIGRVRGISGVWQRVSGPTVGPARPATLTRVTKSGRIITNKVAGYSASREGRRLKLLIRFTDAHPIAEKDRIGWFELAQKIVDRDFDHEFTHAMARALATAR